MWLKKRQVVEVENVMSVHPVYQAAAEEKRREEEFKAERERVQAESRRREEEQRQAQHAQQQQDVDEDEFGFGGGTGASNIPAARPSAAATVGSISTAMWEQPDERSARSSSSNIPSFGGFSKGGHVSSAFATRGSGAPRGNGATVPVPKAETAKPGKKFFSFGKKAAKKYSAKAAVGVVNRIVEVTCIATSAEIMTKKAVSALVHTLPGSFALTLSCECPTLSVVLVPYLPVVLVSFASALSSSAADQSRMLRVPSECCCSAVIAVCVRCFPTRLVCAASRV